MFGNKKNSDGDRFIVTYQQGTLQQIKVIVDKKTGVNYLFTINGYGGGLTVLLDREGKPVITSTVDNSSY
ncbi:DUF6440 family protein [Clostridium cellulovorans]|uniref:DUF6440 domain-containing protein n=1 Tax=Clostridium cellulovorans (strain ATCC 35296 / DSM 3052 / OCM 3 / 743B) TaxID=573061 RepID=D9STR1_CLOC7|nr:DUF6440 family protein [Clostridium cellulovorans]ADL52795.1 hypothetical protein Clocel_3105 [Clostridium cellulovorans 743B]